MYSSVVKCAYDEMVWPDVSVSWIACPIVRCSDASFRSSSGPLITGSGFKAKVAVWDEKRNWNHGKAVATNVTKVAAAMRYRVRTNRMRFAFMLMN